MTDAVERREPAPGVVHLAMNRPERRNSLDDEMVTALSTALDEANDDQAVKVVVVSGNGRAFCAGGDIMEMYERKGIFGGSPAEIRHHYSYGIQRLPRTLATIEVPVIAAVQGYAVGGGTDLAGMCDLRLAADDAVFSERFVKLGIISGDGGGWIWPRLIGMQNAYRMALTGDWIEADEAKSLGLVLDVVPAGELLDHALGLAKRIAENSGPAVRAAKRLIREGSQSSIAASLDLAASIQAGLHHTPEHRDAVAAIVRQIEERRSARARAQ